MDTWIAPDALFDGASLQTGLAIRVSNLKVTEIAPAPKGARALGGTLAPGFVDLQVNGGGGVMINTTPTADGMRIVSQAHRRLGTVAILPTVITDDPAVLDAAAEAAITAFGSDGIIGLHIEGPHIAQARRGTHAAKYIRPMDQRTLDCVQKLRLAGVPVMITVAPEAVCGDQITALSSMGAVVSLGHTDAAAQDINAAISAGASCGTHLFNAMSPMIGRAAGAVGALINSECYTGIICDGHHVTDDMVGLAIRARPRRDRMFLVSDAMATVGGPDQFDLYGKTISIKNGQLVNSEGSLAGAHVTQAQGLQRLVRHVGIDLETALNMAVTTPAACIARPDLATLVGRDARDLVMLAPNLDYLGDLSAHMSAPSNAAE